MIQSLDDAWKWYTAIRTIAYDMRHLAGIWDEPALETVLSLDDRLRHRTAADLKDAVNTILGTDKYRLVLSDDGTTLGGITWDQGAWDAEFMAKRQAN